MGAERHLVLGYTWSDGGVRLRLRGPGGEIAHRVLEGPLALHVTGERRCTGYVDDDGLAPCPDDASPVGLQCEGCLARDRFRPCMTCDGFRCPRLDAITRDHCRRTHHLYLACFGDVHLKVGTAADGRRDQRIVEQGPLAAARVASGEGPTIKQMEHLLATGGPFTETMRRSRKTALLRGGMTEGEARRLVAEAADQLGGLLPSRYHELLHPPIFVEQPDLARRSRALTVNDLAIEPDTTVDGQVVGAVGHVLFVREPAGTFAIDLGQLRGRVVVFDPVARGRRPTVQLGLF